MTGKLADKLPLTMSSLINTIPDSLYPEEDIPTSMNIFTSTESINHYSQMNTGKISLYFLCLCVCASVLTQVVQTALCAEGNSCPRAWSTCLRSGCCAQSQIPVLNTFRGQVWHTPRWLCYTVFNEQLSGRPCVYFFFHSLFYLARISNSAKCQDLKPSAIRAALLISKLKKHKNHKHMVLYIRKPILFLHWFWFSRAEAYLRKCLDVTGCGKMLFYALIT